MTEAARTPAPIDGALSVSQRPLSPSALVSFTACVHLTELERAREAGLVKKPHFADSTLDALIARGREHERAFLADLRANGLDIVEIATDELGTRSALEGAAHATENAMRAGASVIYQA